MAENEARNRFERLTGGPKTVVIEAAFQADVLWVNTAKIYGFSDSEAPEIRAYIRGTYKPDGTAIAP